MSESTPITGEPLIQLCAQRITQRNGNTENITTKQREIEHYSKVNVKFQAEIDAMQAAIISGQPYTPPES